MTNCLFLLAGLVWVFLEIISRKKAKLNVHSFNISRVRHVKIRVLYVQYVHSIPSSEVNFKKKLMYSSRLKQRIIHSSIPSPIPLSRHSYFHQMIHTESDDDNLGPFLYIIFFRPLPFQGCVTSLRKHLLKHTCSYLILKNVCKCRDLSR